MDTHRTYYQRNTKIDIPTAQEKRTGTAIIPYTPGISEKLRRISIKYGIRTVSDQVLHYEAYYKD